MTKTSPDLTTENKNQLEWIYDMNRRPKTTDSKQKIQVKRNGRDGSGSKACPALAEDWSQVSRTNIGCFTIAYGCSNSGLQEHTKIHMNRFISII